MICYEVSLNGRQLCVAGTPGYGVLSAHVVWVKRDPARRRKGEPRDFYGVEEHELRVGGLFGEENLEWVPARRIRSGDVVRIRVLQRATADEPVERKRMDRPLRTLHAKKAHLAHLVSTLPLLRREIRDLERKAGAASSGRARAKRGR